jgi:hypothetical protein
MITLGDRGLLVSYAERVGKQESSGRLRVAHLRLLNQTSGSEAEDGSMDEKRFKRIVRPATAEERQRHAEIREKILEEFPPAEGAGRAISPPGIPSQIRQTREARGLTWLALAELAGIGDSNSVRDIEYGRDAPFSHVQAVAKALGLRLELLTEKV